MAELSERQIKEQDVDWYCLVNGKPTHIGSMGGMIPAEFREREKLRVIQDAVAGMEPFSEVVLNTEEIQRQVEKGYEYLQDETIREAVENANRNHPGFQYLRDYDLIVRLFASTFVEKARRGFRSFARKESAEGNEYVLIAEPVNPVEYKVGDLRLVELKCESINNNMEIVF